MTNSNILIKTENLKKYFVSKNFLGQEKQIVKALDGISLEIYKGETFGLVGESGSGKSTFGRSIIRMHDPTDGKIFYKGKDISNISKKDLKKTREKMQIIFQDPYSSLNPYMLIEDIISEPLELKKKLSRKDRLELIDNILLKVGLHPDDKMKFPREFSGGQLQRIGIARALITEPEFIVCDEPISALDVSIQAQVVNLLKKFQNELGLTYLFVAHDLSMIHYISDRIGVMYLGKIVELATSDELINNPLHPYTKMLLNANPIADPIQARKQVLNISIDPIPFENYIGNVSSFGNSRPHACAKCQKIQEGLKGDTIHEVACFHY